MLKLVIINFSFPRSKIGNACSANAVKWSPGGPVVKVELNILSIKVSFKVETCLRMLNTDDETICGLFLFSLIAFSKMFLLLNKTLWSFLHLFTSGCVWQWRQAAAAQSVFATPDRLIRRRQRSKTRRRKTDRSAQQPARWINYS